MEDKKKEFEKKFVRWALDYQYNIVHGRAEEVWDWLEQNVYQQGVEDERERRVNWCPYCTRSWFKEDVPAFSAIRDAWLDEGRCPAFHRKAQKKLEKEWPTLYRALDQLSNTKKETKDD